MRTQMVASGHDEHGLFHPIVFPFREPGGVARTSWLGLVDYIPVLNLIVMRGWRLELVRRMAKGEDQKLPEAKDIVRFVGQGVLLWAMTLLYALVPIVIIANMGWGGIRDLINDVASFFVLAWNLDVPGMIALLKTELLHGIYAALVDASWLLISLPLYRAAMIRYAVTRKVSAFFNVPANLLFVIRNAAAFIKIYLFAFLVTGIIILISIGLAMTVVGAFLIPLLTIPLYYWSSGFEYGELARELELRLNGGSEVEAAA